MPSPIGHLLAGVAVAWSLPRGTGAESSGAPADSRRTLSLKLAVLCAVLAALPDADLLYTPIHRTVTHSLTSAVLVTIIATCVTDWVTGRYSARIGLLCGAAWASHILLDWLGSDTNSPRGIQALWPFSDRWLISELDLFPRVERRQPFSIPTIVTNLKAAAQEIAVVGPFVLALWWVRARKPRSTQETAGIAGKKS